MFHMFTLINLLSLNTREGLKKVLGRIICFSLFSSIVWKWIDNLKDEKTFWKCTRILFNSSYNCSMNLEKLFISVLTFLSITSKEFPCIFCFTLKLCVLNKFSFKRTGSVIPRLTRSLTRHLCPYNTEKKFPQPEQRCSPKECSWNLHIC